MTKGQKGVKRRRKDHKEVTRRRKARREDLEDQKGPGKKGDGPQEKTRMEGNAKAEARGTKGRGTLGAPKLVGARQVEGDEVRQVEGGQLLGVRWGETNCLG